MPRAWSTSRSPYPSGTCPSCAPAGAGADRGVQGVQVEGRPARGAPGHPEMSAPIAVIGAGAWGTALAWLLAGKGEQVRLWAFEREVAYGIVASHENKLFLPGVPLPAALEPTTSLAEAVDGVQLVVFVVPSHAAARVAASLAPHLPARAVCHRDQGDRTGEAPAHL